MSNRDQFLRQPTVPLRRSPTRPVGEADLAAQLEDALGRAGGLLAATAGPVQALLEACRRAGCPPPGVPVAAPAHDLTPQEACAAEALAPALATDAALRRKVQVAAFRHHAARTAVAEAEAARERGRPEPAVIERLRQTLYYLSAYHLEFQADPLVRPLFPGPRTQAAGVEPPSELQRLKRKLAQEAALEAAKELLDGLEAPMRLAGLTLEMLDGTRSLGLKGLLDAGARQARLVSLHIARDEAAIARLRAATRDYATLRATLARVRSAEEAPKVEAAAFPLSGFAYACRQHAALKLLFASP